jgi:dTDP-4-amino-4,6-dideoxygalactose transaminase
MIIASKLPPEICNKTYFNLGRSAFSYLIGEVIKPNKIYLPSFTCWSLVNAVQFRFPQIELEFYNISRDLSPHYPNKILIGEVLVFNHFFGQESKISLPSTQGGFILEDISHAYTSNITHVGDYTFGSLRKSFKVADGGVILNKFFNPVYEKGSNFDSWLRMQAADWKDMREAENMLDRKWYIKDISSQSLEVVLKSNLEYIQKSRYRNYKYLREHLDIGYPLLEFKENEAPLVHNIILDNKKERDNLRKMLAEKGIFTSIHWPTHPLIKERADEFPDTIWLENHIISIPVGQDYNTNDMEYIVKITNSFKP